MRKKSVMAAFLAMTLVMAQPLLAVGGLSNETDNKQMTEMSFNETEDIGVSANSISVNSVSANSVSNNSVSANAFSLGDEDAYGAQRFVRISSEQAGTQEGTDTDTKTVITDETQINLDKIAITTLEMATYKSVTVAWSKVEGATGYEIYRSVKKNSKYELVKTVGANKLSITDKTKNLKAGKTYYYKVRAIASEGSQVLYGAYCVPQKITYSLPTVNFTAAKPAAGGALTLKWKKVKGADGYEIRRSTSENGRYKKLKVVESSTAQKYTLTATECNGSYYYKIRAYRIVDGKKVYGQYSVARAAEMKNLAYYGETFAQKCKRVFGTVSYKRYASENTAKKYMTTITVNVWDFDAKGNKVTKQKTIMVHKNLALTVEQIFKEIYEGTEKFPIKSVGGFSWRGEGSSSEHNQGTAIDINPNENYMIEGDGTISSGTCWEPGINPYSIPEDGEVVKIFKKYGFSWGGKGWSSGRKDYMHFSYFGT
jgi:hypothetical protein